MKKYLLIAFLLFACTLNYLSAQCPPPGYPPAGDTCPEAAILCQDLDGYCDVLDNNNVQQGFPGCPANALNNDEWFAFIAGSTTIDILVTPSNCQGAGGVTGMQGALYEGSCGGPPVATQCGCVTAPFNLFSTTFVIGEIYYIVFDGCAGDICDYVVNVVQGSTIPVPPQDPSPVSGPLMVCPGSTTSYSIPIANASLYDWTLMPASIGTIIGAPTGDQIDIIWNQEGTGQICVQGSNPCGLTSNEVCITVVSENIPETEEYVDVCFGDCVTCAGQLFCAPTPPSGTPVFLTNYLGCDSVVICHVEAIIVPVTDLGQQTFCAPHDFYVCNDIFVSSGIYNSTCTNYQGCDSTVTVDLAILDPEAVIVTPPPMLDCSSNSTVTLDASNSTIHPLVPNGDAVFLWTGPGIVGPNDDVLVVVDEPGQYCFTVTHSRNGISCSDQECVTVTQNTDVPQTPTLNGTPDPCEGDVIQYTVTSNGSPAPDDYTWTTPNGEPFTVVDPTTIEVTWNNLAGGQLCVTADNDCGTSPPACMTITVTESADQPIVNGPTTVCANNDLQTYNVTNPETGVTYNWTVPPGASYSGSGSSIDVNFSGASPGTEQVCVTATNDCGTTTPSCVTVEIGVLPVMPVLSGPVSACANNDDYTFMISNPQAGDNYNWTAPPGATITGNGATVSINFNGASSGQVCVSAANDCGTTMQDCQAVTVIPVPTAEITGSGSFCEGSGETVNLTITLSGNGPWDVTYTRDNANPTTLTINNSPYTLTVSEAGIYELTTLAGSGNCDGTVSGSSTVTEHPEPTAMLSGSGSICDGSGVPATLTIDLTGTAPWTIDWTVDNNAQAPIVANNNPYTLNIPQAQAGDIALTGVTDGNDCEGVASGTATVTVNTAPAVSMIETDCNALATEYEVSFTVTGGDPATYTVDPATGTWNGNMFTSNPITAGQGYSFMVFDANGCDTITVSQAAVLCNCNTSAGETDLAAIEECGDGPVSVPYDNTNEMLDPNDVLVFILHSGNSVSVIAPVIGEFATPDVSFDPANMTYGTTYYLSAVAGNDNGAGGVDLNDPCLDVSQGTPITFYEIPTATLSGDPAICEGETASLTVDFTGEGPWSISYDDGSGVQTVNGITSNPYTLSVSPDSTTTFCLTGMSDVNCPGNQTGCSMVTVNTGVSYSDLNVECNNTATGYTITFTISGGDPNSYIVTGVSGNINNGVFTSDLQPAGTGFSLTIDDANSCDPQMISQTSVICDCNTDAGDMDPATIEECGDGPVTAADALNVELDGDDIQLYYLHTASGNSLGTVIAINAMPEFSFDPAAMTYGTTYYISSVVGNNDGMGGIDVSDPCLSVAPGTPVVFYEIPTATIAGGTEICPGGSVDLMINLTGDSPWSVTINGEVIDNINGTPFTYSVTPDSTTVYNLTNVDDENCSNAVFDSQEVVVHYPPVVSAVDVDCNDTGTGFTVCIDISGGDVSGYTVTPPNGTLTGSQFCSDEIPDGQGYSFSITDGHGCPPVVVSEPLVDCTCLTAAGDMDAETISICGNEQAVANYDPTNQVLDADDVLCFIIHNGNEVPIATNPDEPAFSFIPGQMTLGQTYYICAAVGNDNGSGCVDFSDNCAILSGCAEVVFNAEPSAMLSGSQDICENESAQLNIDLTGVAPWTLVYMDAAGNNVTETVMSSPFQLDVSPAASTVYSLVSIEDANCAGAVSGNAVVNVNAAPQVGNNILEDCDAIGDFYTVSFNIVGGDPASYTIDPPGTMNGNTFTSMPIPNADPYTFLIDDANGCGPTEVTGIHACNCNTDAGAMVPGPLSLCEDETATAAHNGNEVLDPNDVLVFVLHTNSNNTIGTIIDVNTTPVFNFNPATMTPGVTYYISAVAGNDDGNGNYDPGDPCLDVTSGTPVVFYPIPAISISGEATICEGESTTVTLSVTGTPPFDVTYMENGQSQTIPVNITGNFDIDLTPSETTTIQLISITDQNGCSSTSNESVTVTVNNPVEAGEATGDVSFCANENQTVNLNDQLTGADSGGQWTGPNGQNIPGGQLNTSGLPAGTYPYTYTVTGQSPCPDDEAFVTVVIDPVPVADAGADQSIDCNVTEVTLGGTNTTPGATYTWSGGGALSNPNSANPVASTPGIYTLEVINNFGCSSSDQVEVEQTVGEPVLNFSAVDVSCFGRTDGFVIIEDITNGVPPYLVSLDNGPFLSQQQFLNLAPGDHTLTVEDNAGCETIVPFTIQEPVEVTADIVANFAGNDPIVGLGESVDLNLASTPVPAMLDTIIWSPSGVDSACIGCPSITVTPTQQTVYQVTVDKNGCRDEALITIFISKDRPVFVPNAFSPNEDGINDLLNIYGGASVAEVKSFLVFNRWGETVFEYYNFPPAPIDQGIGWDGYHRGESVNAGVFTWFAEVEFIDGSTELYEGAVNVVK